MLYPNQKEDKQHGSEVQSLVQLKVLKNNSGSLKKNRRKKEKVVVSFIKNVYEIQDYD